MVGQAVCRYWKPHQHGGCRDGDACPYKHLEPSSHPCRDFADGYCPKGDHCRYAHVQPHSSKAKHQQYPSHGASHRQHQYPMHDPSDRHNCSHHADAQQLSGRVQDTVPGPVGPYSKPADPPVDREESGLIKDKQVRKAAQKLISFFDSDGSGQVSADEVQARVDGVTKHTKGKVRVPSAAGDKVVKVLDEDGTGAVDEKEMYQGLKKVANVVNAVAKATGKNKSC